VRTNISIAGKGRAIATRWNARRSAGGSKSRSTAGPRRTHKRNFKGIGSFESDESKRRYSQVSLMRKKEETYYAIGVVSKMFNIHQQTLRLYEREGLLKPARSDGNTRLYSEKDLERLELILNLSRDMGVNLAGVDIILNLREKIQEMQQQINELVQYLK